MTRRFSDLLMLIFDEIFLYCDKFAVLKTRKKFVVIKIGIKKRKLWTSLILIFRKS